MQEVDSLEKEQARTLRLRERLQQPVESVEYVDDVIAVDTLPSGSDAVMIVLFNDNTWKYLRNRDYVKDSEVYTRCWDTTKLFPYRDSVALSDLPRSVDIQLVDSLRCYHYPYKANIRSKFGMRRRRKHQGVDLPLKTGDPVYATFNGKVRISVPSSTTTGWKPSTDISRNGSCMPESGSKRDRSSGTAAARAAVRGRISISRPVIAGSRSTRSV